MKLASHLWKSRHGIYYIRISHCGIDIKRSLKTRDPLIAKSFAYKLGTNMTIPKELLANLLSGKLDTKVYSIKSDGIEIKTDGTPEDHANVIEALKLAILLKNTSAQPNTIPHNSISKLWTLQACIDEYRAERGKSVESRTNEAWDTDFRQLATGLGEESIVSQIHPDQYAAWRMKTVDHLVPTSQDTKNGVYKLFFEWCIERKRCTSNPVVILKLNKNMRAELQSKGGKPRFPYDKEDLYKIFNPELRATIKKPCLFWLPLIAFYSGARLEELGAIEFKDINEYETGKWQVKIRKTKNKASKRTIPIHPEIINAGFINYLNDVKKTWPVATSIFPYFKPVGDRLTHRFSQDYGTFKTSLGLTTGKDFHSFRTTLIGCLKRNKAGDEIKRAYVGHENEGKKDEHAESYGDKTPFLVAEIENDIFPKIDFYHSHGFVMPIQKYNREKLISYLRQTFKKNLKNQGN